VVPRGQPHARRLRTARDVRLPAPHRRGPSQQPPQGASARRGDDAVRRRAHGRSGAGLGEAEAP
jgi:hypothetical protein